MQRLRGWKYLGLLLPFVGLSAGVMPLLVGGYAMGHDWLPELVRIAEFHVALRDGQLPPFWAPDLYGGLGSPIFLFYPPLFLAVSSMFVPLVGSISGAASAALIIFTIIGAMLMWRLIRTVCAEFPGAARIGVVLYLLHPYLLADKWIRNANAEFAALSLLPGVLMGAAVRNQRSAFWWTSISMAGVILAHNLTGLVAVFLAIGISVFVHRNLHALLPVGAGILAALGLTAFFWVPALAFLPLVRSEDLVTGKFDFHGQFPTVTSLFSPSAFYSGGWLTAVLLAAVLFAPVADQHARRIVRAFAIAAVVFIFLMLPVSRWLWEIVPLLRYEQFPWRLMGPLAVVLAAGGAIGSKELARYMPLWSVEFVIVAIALLNAYPALKYYQPLSAEVRRAAERLLTPRGIQSNDLRATIYDEYLPRTASLGSVSRRETTGIPRRWAFPVWSVKVDGQPVLAEQGADGLLSVQMPPGGEGRISLYLVEPPLRKICKGVSIVTLIALFCFGWYRRIFRRNRDLQFTTSSGAS